MKPERMRERMQPLLQPLRNAAKDWPDFDRTWPACATSAGETFIHAVAAMAVTHNARLGTERLITTAVDVMQPVWLADLVVQMGAYMEDLLNADRTNVPLRSVTFLGSDAKRYGVISMKTTRAQISVFSGGKDGMPMWLSRRSSRPILDPDIVDLTTADCEECIAMMRRELTNAGVTDAATMKVEMGRQTSGGHGAFVPDMSSRTIKTTWSDDATTMSVTIPGHDLSQPDGFSRSIVRLDAYAIVHGPASELKGRLTWHAGHIASVLSTRGDLLVEFPAVRQMIDEAARSKGAPEGGIVQECNITQSGKALQVHCHVITYDEDSYRKKIRRVNYHGSSCEEIAKAARRDLSQACRDYARIRRRTGSAPYEMEAIRDVEFGPYRIDLPLVRLIESRLPGRLQEIASTLLIRGYAPEDVRPGVAGPMHGVSMHLEKGCIRGYFDIAPNISWRGGKLRISDLTLPQSMRTSITGNALVDVVRHDLFDDVLTVSSTTTRDLAGGVQVTYLHVANDTAPLAEVLRQG